MLMAKKWQKTKYGGNWFLTNDEPIIITTTNLESNYNEVEGERIRHSIYYSGGTKSDIFHLTEEKIEEAERCYNIFGDEVSALRPCAVPMQLDLPYQRLQEE